MSSATYKPGTYSFGPQTLPGQLIAAQIEIDISQFSDPGTAIVIATQISDDACKTWKPFVGRRFPGGKTTTRAGSTTAPFATEFPPLSEGRKNDRCIKGDVTIEGNPLTTTMALRWR